MTAARPGGGLAAALAASLLLHGAAIQGLSRLPRGLHAGDWSLDRAGTGRLRATLVFPVAPAEPAAAEIPAMLPEVQGAPSLPVPVASVGREAQPAPSPAPTPEPPADPGSGAQPGAGVLDLPVYYTAGQLDQRPLIKVHIHPAFPPGAPADAGRVVLRLYIDERGEVERISVVSADPAGAFEDAAVHAFSVARFTPGVKNGAPVRSQVTLEVLFGAPPPPQGPAPRP